MNEGKTIKLELTLDEVNVILSGLGSMPYSQVFSIIHKIHQQAQSQMSAGSSLSAIEPGE